MDNETKNILKILGVAVGVLFLLKPKKGKSAVKSLADAVSKPKVENSEEVTEKQFEDGIIAIKAYRSAINNKESQEELNKLNRVLLKDYGLKVTLCTKSGKLTARSSKGQDVAKEE
jgi:hypothetical protein